MDLSATGKKILFIIAVVEVGGGFSANYSVQLLTHMLTIYHTTIEYYTIKLFRIKKF